MQVYLAFLVVIKVRVGPYVFEWWSYGPLIVVAADANGCRTARLRQTPLPLLILHNTEPHNIPATSMITLF